ncbi:MAG: hypothetical protein HY241_13155 [Actinobacteria bacterium]|nr:hypothetical protein [Actinomycetota bacterium]
MSAQAGLTLDHTVAECGGAVIGTASWSGNRTGKRVGVVLRYRTQGRGDVDTAVVASCDLGIDEAGQARFRLCVPPYGPITYHGQLLRLLWQAAVQIPRHPASAIVELTVLPRGWALPPLGSPGWRGG